MIDRKAAWRHVAATGIIRRLVEGHDPEAVSAGIAFLETEHPSRGEYMEAMIEETERRIDSGARRMVPDRVPAPPSKDKRTALQECLHANPHSPASADAILNALHQAGWAIVPKSAVPPPG